MAVFPGSLPRTSQRVLGGGTLVIVLEEFQTPAELAAGTAPGHMRSPTVGFTDSHQRAWLLSESLGHWHREDTGQARGLPPPSEPCES